MIAAGTYEENVVVDVDGVTITGLGEVTIQGTFETDNSVTGDLSDWIATASPITVRPGRASRSPPTT